MCACVYVYIFYIYIYIEPDRCLGSIDHSNNNYEAADLSSVSAPMDGEAGGGGVEDKSPIQDENDEEVPRAHKASTGGKKRKETRSKSVRDRETSGGRQKQGGITDEERERRRGGEKRAYGPHLSIARGR